MVLVLYLNVLINKTIYNKNRSIYFSWLVLMNNVYLTIAGY